MHITEVIKLLATRHLPKIQAKKQKSSLAFWMKRVLEECDRALVAFQPDPVHDLRVALRRCCSIADGVRAIDPDPAWRDMKRAGKRLFRKLGELRDVHVMQDWIHQLDRPGDPVTGTLLQFIGSFENQHQQDALLALQEFDRKQWERWSRSLPRRMARWRPGSLLFRHLALERWTDAYRRHRQSMRKPSPAGFHRLRITIKRFRYIVENFLPLQHAAWSDDLKHLQDLLGDVHDLDVLCSMATQANAFPDAESHAHWQERIQKERTKRIELYMEKTAGKDSLWQLWRAELPKRKEIESAALLRLRLWGSLLDPDFRHSLRVSRFALQLYDGLEANGRLPGRNPRDRAILEMAALLEDVGRAKVEKGHHKTSYRMIRNLTPPLGWPRQNLLATSIVARYHRGALPGTGRETFGNLSAVQRAELLRLVAILRLANAFDASRDGRIGRLRVNGENGFLVIAAEGYSPRDDISETIAAGRHLMETVYKRPVIVKPMKALRTKRVGRKGGQVASNLKIAARG